MTNESTPPAKESPKKRSGLFWLAFIGAPLLFLAAVLVVPMAMGTFSEVKGREFNLELLTTLDQQDELCGRKDRGLDDDWTMVTFSDRLKFNKIGETVDAHVFQVFTLGSFNEVHAGEYLVRTTVRKGSIGPAFAYGKV